MAEEKTILLKVELDVNQLKKNASQAEKALIDLVAEQKRLKASNQQGTVAYKENALAISQQNKIMKDSVRAIDTNTKARKKQTGSLNEMKAQLSAATFQYNNLSKAERENSKHGQKLKTDIRSLSDELKKNESAVGNNTRNVGNYSSALQGVGGAAGGAVGGISRVSASLKLLLMNPVVAVVAGIVGAFMALKKAFSTTEEGQNKMAKATAIVGAVFDKFFDLIEPIASFIGDVVVDAFETLGTVVTAVSEGISKALDWLGFEEAAQGMRDMTAESEKFIETTGKIADIRALSDKEERVLIVDRAKMETKIAQLREKAAKKEQFSAEERIKFLKEAGAINDEIFAREEVISAARLLALQKENQMTNSTKEVKKEQAEAEAAHIRLQEQRAKGAKKIAAELVTTQREAKSAELKILNDRKASYLKFQKEREDVAKQVSKLIFENTKLDIDSEEQALKAKFKFLEESAKGNALDMINVETQKNEEFNALAIKQEAQALALLDAKFAEEIKKAKGNAELLKLIDENKNKEVAAIQIKFQSEKEKRDADSFKKQSDFIDKENALQEKKEAQGVKTANKLAIIQAELRLKLNKGTKEELSFWKQLQDERIRQLKTNSEKQLENTQLTADERKAIEAQTELDIFNIKQEAFNKDQALEEQKRQNAKQTATTTLSAAQSLSNALFQIDSNRIQDLLNKNKEKTDEENELLTQQLDAGLISQAEFDQKKNKLDVEFAAKETKLKKEKFKKEKTAALISAAINTAVGVTAAAPVIPLMVLTAALGAIEIATIASQPTPKFKDGGQVPSKSGVFGGNLHSSGGTKGSFSDGTQVEVERDEAFFILNRKASASIAGLSNINQQHGGAPLTKMKSGGVMKFEGGGAFANNISQGADNSFKEQNNILEAFKALPPQVVLVQDINYAQGDVARVENLADF